MPLTKPEARELMSLGYEMGATVINGTVRRKEDGTWAVGEHGIEQWLQSLEGQEVVVVGSEISEVRGQTRVCRTCGTEYEGHECPRCRAVHRRLRGR
jgi:hypothetical protein